MTETMKSVTLAERPSGQPTPQTFRLETAPIPTPGEGEVLVRTLWLSLDPYMRGRMDESKSYAKPVPIGGVMEGEVVAEVIASHHPGFAVGEIVAGRVGWTTHAVSDGRGLRKIDPSIAPLSTALGVLGMPGHTAWVGLNDILAAEPGETIVVSAATGAVGSLVCQLAKLKGMRVIGVAGGAEKCAYAVKTLGCDACLDHRAYDDAASLSAALAEAAPDGIHCYYENVGGKTLEAVLDRISDHGRIAVCGMISWYSGRGLAEAMPLPRAWRAILTKRLRVQGFIIFDHNDRRDAFLAEVAPMVQAGKIVFRETVAEGIEAAPEAFLSLLEGGNFGKQLVRIASET
jgi:NADPH-dependent curcumin reductase CurA